MNKKLFHIVLFLLLTVVSTGYGQTLTDQELIDLINQTPPPSSGQLKNTLIDNSPLTDVVLIALLNNHTVLSNGDLQNVLNTNAPLSTAVLDEFWEIQDQLPNGIVNNILSTNNLNELIAADCGITLSDLSQTLTAETVTGAIQYGFRVTNTNLNFEKEVISNDPTFNLTELGVAISYNTTYQVQTNYNDGNIITSYGPPCDVTTNDIPGTQLITGDCGNINVALDQLLSADEVLFAIEYEFLVENTSIGFSESVVKNTNQFTLLEMSQAILPGTTYNIQVRAIEGQTMGAYGTVCSITTELHQLTQLISEDCNSSVSQDQSLEADIVAGASQYEFLVENSGLGFSESIQKTSNSFRLDELAGTIEPSTPYTVQVRTTIGSSVSAYGPVCTVTTTTADKFLVNKGAFIKIKTDAKVKVKGCVTNKGTGFFDNEGQVTISHDVANNATTKMFSSQHGKVILNGDHLQKIDGTNEVDFYHVDFQGGGDKEMNTDVNAFGITDIQDQLIATKTNTYRVRNNTASSLLRTTGYFTSEVGGGLLREMNQASDYVFPVGANRYLPMEIKPTTTETQSFKVGFINHSPEEDGFDFSNLPEGVVGANPNYYHKIDRTTGISAVNYTFFFEDQLDQFSEGIIAFNPNTALWVQPTEVQITQGTGPFAITMSVSNFSLPVSLFSGVVTTPFGGLGATCLHENDPALKWIGAQDNNWKNPQNWVAVNDPTNSLPTFPPIMSSVNVVIEVPQEPGNYPIITAADTATTNNFCLKSGTLDLRVSSIDINGDASFVGGNVINGGSTGITFTIIKTPSIPNILFDGTTFDTPIDATALDIKLNGSTFNQPARFDVEGTALIDCEGGNVYNDVVEIISSNEATWNLAHAVSGGLRDIYNSDVKFVINGTSIKGSKINPSSRYNDIYKGNVAFEANNSDNTQFRFGQNGGVAQFSGGVEQRIQQTGSEDIDAIFKKMTINKTSNDVVLEIPIRIGEATGDELSLIKGKLITNQTNSATVGADVTAINASGVSYVQGPLIKEGAEEFVFPVGKNNSYMPISVSAGTIATDKIEAEYFDEDATDGTTLASTLIGINNCEHWTLKRIDAVGDAINRMVGLSHNNGICGVSTTPDNLVVAQLISGIWEDKGNQNTTGLVLSENDIDDSSFKFTTASRTIKECTIPYGLFVSNYGANIHVNAGTNLNIFGNYMNEQGPQTGTDGEVELKGKVRLTRDWIHNAGNEAISLSSDGVVELVGTEQTISGSSITTFYDLDLLGYGTKSMCVDAKSRGQLNLNWNELATNTNTFFVENKNSNAIVVGSGGFINGTGFVSSLSGGYLSREMGNPSIQYEFPLGAPTSSNPYLRRPIKIETPFESDERSYRARLVPGGFNADQKDVGVDVVSDKYHYEIERENTATAANVEIFYNSLEDGLFQLIGYWDGPSSLWKKTVSTTTGSLSGPLNPPGIELTDLVKMEGWDNFDDRQFAPLQNGFKINTDEIAGGSSYTVTQISDDPNGDPSSGTGNEDPIGDPVYPTDGTENITPDGLGGVYAINIHEGECNTPLEITFSLSSNGTMDPNSVSVVTEDNSVKELSDELFRVESGNELVLFEKPQDFELDCDNLVEVDFSDGNGTPFLYTKSGNTPISISGSANVDMNNLVLRDEFNQIVPINIVNNSNDMKARIANNSISDGVYTFELSIPGSTETFKGQFIVE